MGRIALNGNGPSGNGDFPVPRLRRERRSRVIERVGSRVPSVLRAPEIAPTRRRIIERLAMDLPTRTTRTSERPFLHKKILGGISKLAGILPVPGGQFISAITSRLGGGAAPPVRQRPPSRIATARVTQFSQAEKQLGRQIKFASDAGFAPPPCCRWWCWVHFPFSA